MAGIADPYNKASADIASMYAQLQAKMRGEDVNSINANYDANKKSMNGAQQAAAGITNQGYASSNSSSAALLASLGIGGLAQKHAAATGSRIGHDQDFNNNQINRRGGASARWSDDERAASLAYNGRIVDAAGMEGAAKQKQIAASLAAAMAAMSGGGGGGGGGGGRGGRGGGGGDDEEPLEFFHQYTDNEARSIAANQRRYEAQAEARARAKNGGGMTGTQSILAARAREAAKGKAPAKTPVKSRAPAKTVSNSGRRTSGGRF